MKPKTGNKFKRSYKSKQKGIQVTGKWKPIEIDPSFFANEQLGDLICFEELTNYKLVASTKVGEAKSKKRKSKDKEEDEVLKESSPSPIKKRKKGKHMKSEAANSEEPKAKEIVITRETMQEDTIVHGDQDESIARHTTSPKRKKIKKKKKACPSHEVIEPAKPSRKSRNWTSEALAVSSDEKVDMSAWKGLFVPKPVLRALSVLGFSAPTPIQALALPSAIRDSMDILGAAETGSGKTLAFAIPMIHSILQWQKSKGLASISDGCLEEEADGEEDMTCQEATEEAEGLNSDTDEAPGADQDDSKSLAKGCMKMFDDKEFDLNSQAQDNVVKGNPLLGLVLTPTRELAVQVKHHIDAVAKFTGIRTAILVGGMAPQKQQRVLRRKPEIVIATPGRLWELIQERHPHLSSLRQLSLWSSLPQEVVMEAGLDAIARYKRVAQGCRCLVIDEADRMVERGHFAELSQLLEMLNDSQFNPKRQIFVFSATLTLIHQTPTRVLQKKNVIKIDKKTKLEMLMQKVGIKGKPKVIDLTRKQATVETLTETRIHCDTEEKDYYLYYFLLQYPGRTMVFANSIDCIKRLTALLTILDCSPLPLHANMHQKQRLKNLERFADRDSCILLTTDVAARGLDIPNVQHVIHYQVPRTSEIYVHRSGRTARAASEGLSLLLIGPSDMIHFKRISKTLEKTEKLPFFPVETKYMSAIKERVNLARQIEKVEYFNSRAKHHNSWLQQAAEALELDLDDDELLGGRPSEQEENEKQKMLKVMKKQLKYFLSQPIFKNLMKTKYPTQYGKLLLPDLTGERPQSALGALSKAPRKKNKKQ